VSASALGSHNSRGATEDQTRCRNDTVVRAEYRRPKPANLWSAGVARDPATDTLADAAVWESRAFFYKDAMAASKYAFDASRAQSAADFRKSAKDLRLTCDGCHSTYQHKD
jgi:cytochrome c556